MMEWLRTFPLLALVLLVGSSRTDAQPSYRVSFPERENHYVSVMATIPSGGAERVELWMASWTPGSYKIRDYSRHVESLEAFTPSGTPIQVEKGAKSRWTVPTPGLDRFELRYRLYCREMSVRTNFVERDFAMLNGAATWIVPVGSESSPTEVRFLLPPEWPHCETALPPHPSGDPHRYLSPDYDTLADSPILIGDLDIRPFEVGGVEHFLVSHGGDPLWNFARAAEDCRRIVEAQTELWGVIPYRSYRFLNVIAESGGGLEHKDSTLMLTSRYSFREEDRYRSWLGLVSHEFFHTWNVKRLRPVALGPFDYTREVHTDDLWVVEGITSYYDDLMLARAGLADRKQYLKALSKQIETVQTTPGRRVHALADTSHDAWTHHYQRNENSVNSTISYYTKGAVVGFLLDLEIRRLTDDARSLDDAMRLAYARYSGERGYTSEEFRAVCSEVAGQELAGFFARAVDSTEELDYAPALAWLGLRFRPEEKKDGEDAEDESTADGAEEVADAAIADPAGAHDQEGEEKDAEEERVPGWIGLSARDQGGRLVVTSVRRGTIAYDIGLTVGDEIIAVDRFRVPADGWSARMKQYEPGDEVTLLIARRGELIPLDVILGEKPKELWKLEVVKEPTPEQTAHLAAWLGEAGRDLLEPDERE